MGHNTVSDGILPIALTTTKHRRRTPLCIIHIPPHPSPPLSTLLKQISQIVLTTIGITHATLPEKITRTFATTEHQAFNDNVRQTDIHPMAMNGHAANKGRR
jgi:hypothetical protein